MRAIEFPEHNIVFAKDQPEYQPLPARKTDDGKVTSCWRLTWRERLAVLFGGRVYVTQLTFNQSLQPLLPSTRLISDEEWARDDRDRDEIVRQRAAQAAMDSAELAEPAGSEE